LILELYTQWRRCLSDLSIESDAEHRQHTFEILVNAYTQPDRHYHNLNHIYHLLTTIERFDGLVQDSIALSLAAWFHDFVYDPRATDNEAQSAKAAGDLLTNIGISSKLIDRVQQLILATQGHQIDAEDRDRCIFLDTDLAILGTDPVAYQVYARSIRREYGWVSDAAYQTGRIRVLEPTFRTSIFTTDT
jgi:predicted metal-dependent HD superfamily phosphohydrolase